MNVWVNTVVVAETNRGEWCADCYEQVGIHQPSAGHHGITLIRVNRQPGTGEGKDFFGNHT